MSEFRLHYSPSSPYARKVRVALRETGLLDRTEEVLAKTEPLSTGSSPIAQNPLGKIPVLERPDGPPLYDSRVICRYLDHKSGHALYPQGSALFECLTVEATAEGMMDAALLMVMETRLRDAEIVSDRYIEANWTKIMRAASQIEDQWLSEAPDDPDIAWLSVAIVLDYCDFRLPDRDWRGALPRLAEWHQGISARPSLVDTQPKNA